MGNRKSKALPPTPQFDQVSYGNVIGVGIPPVSEDLYVFPISIQPPAEVDLRKTTCSPYFPVFNQLDLGNCTSQATVAAFMCAQRKDPAILPRNYIVPSTMFNYYFAREMSGVQNVAAGTSIKQSVEALKNGIAPEPNWPNTNDWRERPSVEAQRLALHYAAKSATSVRPDIANLQRGIAAGFSIVMAFEVTSTDDGWFKDRQQQVASDFIISDNNPSAEIVAGHAVLMVGYNNAKGATGAFLVRNSWGENWGDNGHFWIPYSIVSNPRLAKEFTVLGEVCSNPGGICVTECPKMYDIGVC